MKIETARRLIELAKSGACVVIWKNLPQSVPGWHNHADREQESHEMLGCLEFVDGVATVGQGRILLGGDRAALMARTGVAREALVDHGLKFIRRKLPGEVVYFVANQSAKPVDRWVPLAAPFDLGDVRESARVRVNGKPAGVLVAHPFRLDLTGFLKAGDNRIEIEVTNLSANRIRDLDRRKVGWKKFHEINIVDHNYKKFDAAEWPDEPSGLLGPVTLMKDGDERLTTGRPANQAFPIPAWSG